MCEVAILDPDRYGIDEITTISEDIYDAMRSSLGIVAIYENGGHFEYSIFKALDPDTEDIKNFYLETLGDEPKRYIIHGRMATTGAVNIEHTHPLEVDCDRCDVDYVLHNGVVYHERMKEDHERDEHTYVTEVDSEAIAHETGTVPDDFDEVANRFGREPCYILLNGDRIFVHGTTGYRLTADLRLSRSHRDFGPDYREESYVNVILHSKEE